MAKSRRRRLGALLGAVLLLLACGLADLPAGLTTTRDADPATTITLVGGQPRTLDPALTRSGPSDVIGHIYSGLVVLDLDLQLQPDLAAGWDISDDATTYTFFLRKNALFHDGRPVTAQDVIFSWERATDPAVGSDQAATYLGDIVGVRERLAGTAATISGLRAVDDYTLEVRIDAPKPYFLAKLTFPVAFIVDRETVDTPNWERAPNGTGPFVLESWQDDQQIVLAKNHAYYRETGNVEHVVYLIGQGIPLALYETGRIDLVGVGGSSLQRALDPNDPLAPDLVTGVSMCTTTIGFDTTRPPFDDARVRQAFNYALDRDTLVNALFGGQVLPARGALPPGMPGYTGLIDTPFRGYDYEPDTARRLLADAGYDTLPPLTYVAAGFDDVNGLVEAAITMWQEQLGADIAVTLLDPYIYYDELYAGRVGNLFSSGWCADYPDPENFLDVLYFSGVGAKPGRLQQPRTRCPAAGRAQRAGHRPAHGPLCRDRSHPGGRCAGSLHQPRQGGRAGQTAPPGIPSDAHRRAHLAPGHRQRPVTGQTQPLRMPAARAEQDISGAWMRLPWGILGKTCGATQMNIRHHKRARSVPNPAQRPAGALPC